MDMGGMDMGGGNSGSTTALNATGVDFSNFTQANDFLGEILDDSVFQITGNQHARYFWYGVVSLIAAFTISNVVSILKMRSRLRAESSPMPAMPSHFVMKALATYTAMIREISNGQFTPSSPLMARMFKVPPTGVSLIVLFHLAFVILLEFMNNDIPGAQHFTSLGIRAAWLGVAQVPLLILLAGKNNLIGIVCGTSYERLNVLHRWTARIMLFLATLHMLFLHLAWNKYGLMTIEYSTDSCIPTGWAVYAILLWLNLSTLAPIRNLSYEFFVVQHIITWIGFLVAVMYHLPSTALYSRVYIYIPIGLYFVDRLIRTLRYVYNNVRPARATLTTLDGGFTKVVVKSNQVNSWSPGAHVLLSIPRFGIGQSHPATIASIPSSHGGDLVFILKAHRGFTGRLYRKTSSSQMSLVEPQALEEVRQQLPSHLTLIDGPYGSSHLDFATFDTSILIAGSTGVCFTLPILLDLALRAEKTQLPLRRLHFVWIIKDETWINWISPELQSAFTRLEEANVTVSFDIFVTCNPAFAGDDSKDEKTTVCGCGNAIGACCCISPVNESTDADGISGTKQASSAVQVSQFSSRQSDESLSLQNNTTSLIGDEYETWRSRLLRCCLCRSGRPNLRNLIWTALDSARGETGVAVCGPLGLSSDVRRTVVWCSDQRAVHKGSGAQGIYLHAECFGW